jgi:hypothetical protein
MDDRSAFIKIDGEEYELLLSTKATKEIAKRYGGLEKLGSALENGADKSLEDVIWLVVTLANATIAKHNLKNLSDKKPFLTEEMVELLTAPFELAEFAGAIKTAMYKGAKREVESETGPELKNAKVG